MNILANWLLALKSRSPAYERAAVDLERVRALPFEEVKQHALGLIRGSGRFRSVAGPGSPNPFIEALGPVLRKFFERFDSVEEINGECCQ